MPKGKAKKSFHRPQEVTEHQEDTSSVLNNESTPTESGGDTFRRRNLENNWKKYDQLPEEEAEVDSYYDFNTLAAKQTFSTDYFMLKAEKEWETESQVPDAQLFTLDIKSVSSALACIPFYERVNIDKKYLTDDLIEESDRDAKMCRVKRGVTNVTVELPLCLLIDSDKKNTNIEISASERVTAVDIGGDSEKSDNELEEWLDSVLNN